MRWASLTERGAPLIAIAALLLAIATPAAAEPPPEIAAPFPPSPTRSPPAPHVGDKRASRPVDAWEATRLPWYAPPSLTYEEGMPLPPGYTLVQRRPKNLLLAGAALFGASYLAAALTAATVIGGHARQRSEVAPLFAPLAGPWITLATSRDAALGDPDRRANGVLAMLDGVAQPTGAALLIAGLVSRKPVLVRTRESYGVRETSFAPEVVLGPRSASVLVRF